MGQKNRGDRGGSIRKIAQDPEAFSRCRNRLERSIGAACEPGRSWQQRVAEAIRAALRFAEAEPVAARILTVHSACRRYGDEVSFTGLVDDLAARLAADAPPVPNPERTARNVVLRIMRQTLLQLELRREGPTAIAADLVVFALTPYVGLKEAQRQAEAAGGM